MEDYVRNDDFGRKKIDTPAFEMKLPDKAEYRDINEHSQLPTFSKETIDNYLTICNATMDDKIKKFYKDNFLIYARWSNKQADDQPSIFIHANCHAEMKKKTTYFIDVKLDKDNGMVLQAQCDCGAGMGPEAHCKHVQIVLWGVHMRGEKGEIITEETCTQVLQTFHKVKKFKGSPVKCADLDLGTENDFAFDPRPHKYRNNPGYPDFVRNLVTNFQSDHRMPIQGIITPANTHAAVHDHDYRQAHPEDQFLIDNNISEITQAKINQIENLTRQQDKSTEWSDERCKRLTASTFHRICTATNRTDHEALATSYTVRNELFTKAVKHGKKYEPVAIEKLEGELGIKTNVCGLYVSQSHPYLAGSPDRIYGDDTVVEVKCPYTAQDEINADTVGYLIKEGDDIILDKKCNYYYQVQGQLFCTGRSRALFGVYAST